MGSTRQALPAHHRPRTSAISTESRLHAVSPLYVLAITHYTKEQASTASQPLGFLTTSYGIITDVPFWHNDVKIHLNFHIFEDLNFDFLIGHPLKALFTDVPKDGCLNIKLGKDTFHIPVDRALTCSVKDLPILEPIEEIMATSSSEFFDLGLEEDIEEMPEEVSDAEEESGETSELLATEKPS